MSSEIKCPECGFSNEGEYCLNCGAELNNQVRLQKLCPECKTPLTEGKKFCGVCGKNTEEDKRKIHETKTYTQTSREKRQKNLLPFIVAGISFVMAILLVILFRVPIYNLVKPEENDLAKLDTCKENLKILARACEEFSKTEGGRYPENLQQLVNTGVLEKLPRCPSCDLPYIYEVKDKEFLIKCGGLNAHIKTELVDRGNLPAYHSGEGLTVSSEKAFLTEQEKPEKASFPTEALPTPSITIALTENMTINLKCYEQGNEISENYECVVKVENIKPDRIHYKWWEHYPGGRSQTGDWIMTEMESSRTYNSLWHNGEYKYTEDTAPWISRKVFKELKEKKTSVLNIDVEWRKDRDLKIYLDGVTEYRLLYNNSMEAFKALCVHTDKNDKLIILDDAINPLVLSADVKSLYEWHVTSIDL